MRARWRAALQPMLDRGHTLLRALALDLPRAAALRAWRRLARPFNRVVLGRWVNGPRLARAWSGAGADPQPTWVVIVMPRVLHFLWPCLVLLQGRARLLLLLNGAADWEADWLRRRLPGLPMLRLAALPGSSVDHGDVIDLLLRHHPGAFGLVDHDAYVFDAGLLARLTPQPADAVAFGMAWHNAALPWPVPLTHLISFNTAALRPLTVETGIQARLYRQTPQVARAAFAALGLGVNGRLKPYQDFHDTLHVLLVMARQRGLAWRFEPPRGSADLVHIGGTSIGSHHTKALFALYLHLRFLELVDDPELRRRYAPLTAPLQSSEQALARRRASDLRWQALSQIDELMRRLSLALRASSMPHHQDPSQKEAP